MYPWLPGVVAEQEGQEPDGRPPGAVDNLLLLGSDDASVTAITLCGVEHSALSVRHSHFMGPDVEMWVQASIHLQYLE
jgi:hypothetical protein